MIENKKKTVKTAKIFKTTGQFKLNEQIMKKKSATNTEKLSQQSSKVIECLLVTTRNHEQH